jgi:capsular exopolysaccharide synthesis family protein
MLPGGSPTNGGPQGSLTHLSPPLQTPTVFWLRDYLGVVRRYVWVVAGITVMTVAVGASIVLKEPPVYVASAAVRLVDTRPTLAADMPAMDRPIGNWTDPVLTQIQVLRSRAVAEAATDSSGIRLQSATRGLSMQYIDKVFVDPRQDADTFRMKFADDGVTARSSRASVFQRYGLLLSIDGVRFTVERYPGIRTGNLLVLTRAEAIGDIMGSLTTRPREMTSIIDIGSLANDPFIAQRSVNAVAKAFQAVNAQSAREQSRRRRLFIEEQLRTTDKQLDAAESRLTAFRGNSQTYSARDKFQAQQTDLADVEKKREQLLGDRRVYTALLERLEKPGGDRDAIRGLFFSPEVTSNPAVMQMYNELTRYETQRDSMTTGQYSRSQTDPDVQSLNALIAGTTTKLIAAVKSYVSSMDARVALLEEQRSRSAGTISGLPQAEVEEGRLTREVETVRKMSDKLREELQVARIAEAVETGQVEMVDLAQSGIGPIGRGRNRKLGFALVVGLALGAVVALLLDRMNTSIRRREDVEGILRVPGLAVIPRLLSPTLNSSFLRRPLLGGARKHERANGAGTLVTANNIRSTGAEAYRKLMTNLLFSVSPELKTLVITSAFPGEGKTTTACNLAITFAQQGRRVLLVDADLRRPYLHHMFGIECEPGLADILSARHRLSETLRPSGVERLSLLTAGKLPPNPLEFLGSKRMKSLLKYLAARYDTVIIDTPPVLAAADASLLGVDADGVVMIVRAGQTDRDPAQQAVRQLFSVGARVVGAVLNDPDEKVPRYGRYHDYYYYYQAESELKKNQPLLPSSFKS